MSGSLAESGPYDREQLGETLIADWRGQDFSIFRYPPARYQSRSNLHSTTRLVLDFKASEPIALDGVRRWAVTAIGDREPVFRDSLQCRWVMSVPGSAAGDSNQPCEW